MALIRCNKGASIDVTPNTYELVDTAGTKTQGTISAGAVNVPSGDWISMAPSGFSSAVFSTQCKFATVFKSDGSITNYGYGNIGTLSLTDVILIVLTTAGGDGTVTFS